MLKNTSYTDLEGNIISITSNGEKIIKTTEYKPYKLPEKYNIFLKDNIILYKNFNKFYKINPMPLCREISTAVDGISILEVNFDSLFIEVNINELNKKNKFYDYYKLVDVVDEENKKLKLPDSSLGDTYYDKLISSYKEQILKSESPIKNAFDVLINNKSNNDSHIENKSSNDSHIENKSNNSLNNKNITISKEEFLKSYRYVFIVAFIFFIVITLCVFF